MTHKLSTCYYLGLTILFFVGIIQTVYEGSLHVTHGHQVAILQEKNQMLTAKKSVLQAQLNQETSLQTVTNYAQTRGFLPIVAPILIAHKNSSTMASR